VAVNCCVAPTEKVAVAGVTAMATSVRDTIAGVTVNVAEPVTPWSVAATVADPAVTPVASPLAVMVAVVVGLMDHDTVDVISEVVLSL
jgi:hypothetical protein